MSPDLKRLLDAALPEGVAWASLRRVRTATRGYHAKDGRFDEAYDLVDEGCMLEVLVDGQFGYAALASLEPGALRAAADRALRLARSAAPWAIFRFDDEVRPPTVLRYESPRRLRAAFGADLLTHHAIRLTEAMKISDRIVQAAASLEAREVETEFVSTSGAAIEQRLHIIGSSLQVIARDGGATQLRSANGPRGTQQPGGLGSAWTSREGKPRRGASRSRPWSCWRPPSAPP